MPEHETMVTALEGTDEIADLLGSIPPTSPVRRVVDQFTAGADQLDVGPLFASLANPSKAVWRERCVAAWALGRAQLGDIERDAAVAALSDVAAPKRTRRTGSIPRAAANGFAAMVLTALAVAILADLWHLGIGRGGFDPGIVMPAVVGVMVYLRSLRPVGVTDSERLRATAATSLGRLRTTDAIAVLAKTLSDPCPDVRQAGASALHGLLSGLTTEERETITEPDAAALVRAIASADPLLSARIVGILGSVGGVSCGSPLDRLAREARTHGLRDAAGRAAAAIRERAARQAQNSLLVRPADGSSVGADTLVRPVAPGPRGDEQQLVRPADAP